MREKYERLLRRLVHASILERVAISVGALVAAIIIGGVIVFVSGAAAGCRTGLDLAGQTFCYNPVQVYYELFLGALGHPFEGGWHPHNGRLATTLQQTTLLLFAGLSVAVAFRAGLFNIGTQGQLVVGGFATAVFVTLLAGVVPGGLVGMLVLIPLGILTGAVFGGLYGAIPGALKAYADANEVITTIMLNFVAVGVTSTLLAWRFQDPDSINPQTRRVPEYAEIPTLPVVGYDPRVNFSLLALGFALVLAIGIAWLLARTSFGYSLRVSGVQPGAAAYGGVDEKRMIVASMTLSGALGGIAGAFWVLMVHSRWLKEVPPLGFDGIAVAVLAGNNPLGVGAAALLFGTLSSGSSAVQTATDVPPELVGIISGLVILFVAMPEFFRMLGRHFGYAEPTHVQSGVSNDEKDASLDDGSEQPLDSEGETTDGGRPVGESESETTGDEARDGESEGEEKQ